MTKPLERPTRYHGERSRWLVPSDSEPIPHFVDLDEYGGVGWCSCKDFEIRKQPTLERKENLPGHDALWRCKHIRRVLEEIERLEQESVWNARGNPMPKQ